VFSFPSLQTTSLKCSSIEKMSPCFAEKTQHHPLSWRICLKFEILLTEVTPVYSLTHSLTHHHHHHHHQAARSSWQHIAVSRSWRHFDQSCARCQAELRPRLCGSRSSSTMTNHVHLGRPLRRCHSADDDSTGMILWRDSSGDVARRSLTNVIRQVTGSWPVLHLERDVFLWGQPRPPSEWVGP